MDGIWTALGHDSEEPKFIYPNFKSWRNVKFDPERGLVPKVEDYELTEVSWANVASRKKYVGILRVLNKIHQLLIDDERITKRELYYQLLSYGGGTANQVAEAVQVVNVMLQIPRGQLRIVATSKGLMAGDLTYINLDGIEVDCSSASHGEPIPNEVDDMLNIKSTAQVVVIVEKDATFQRLLQENFLKLVNYNILLITGKGVPDLSTRKLVSRLGTWPMSSLHK